MTERAQSLIADPAGFIYEGGCEGVGVSLGMPRSRFHVGLVRSIGLQLVSYIVRSTFHSTIWYGEILMKYVG
jgi:hypothetical protein